jgi:hypothetical protein
MARAQHYPILIARRALFAQIKAGDGHLALRFLERREPERYRLHRDCQDTFDRQINRVIPGGSITAY